MKKLVLIIAILALCAPSFGAILVYKQSSSMKGLNLDWLEAIYQLDVYAGGDVNDVSTDTTTLTSAQDTSAKITGYVVMDVNTTTLLINDKEPNADANFAADITASDTAAISDGVAIIIVDKKAKTYQLIYDTQRINAAKTAWESDANYGTIRATGMRGMHKAVTVLDKKGKATKKTLAVLELDGLLHSSKTTDLNEPNYREEGEYSNQYDTWSQEFNLGVKGALKKADVDGSKTKVLIPTSLKGLGSNEVTDETEIEKFQYDPNADAPTSDLYTDDTTTNDTDLGGTASLSLDKKATQTANKATTPSTKGTAATLVAALKADGYTEVLPPAVPDFD